MQSDRQTRQAAGTSDVNGALLTLICPDNHFQTSLSNALSFLFSHSVCTISFSVAHLSPLFSLNVSSSYTHLTRLSHLILFFSLITHNYLSSFVSFFFLSLQPAVAAEKQGEREQKSRREREREVVCVCVCVCLSSGPCIAVPAATSCH